MMKNLRKYIRMVLLEAMQANIDNFGLYKSEQGNSMHFVLYDAVSFVQTMKKEKKMIIDKSMILGNITVRKHEGWGPCHDAWEITSVAAVKGFGPTMYDIAMNHVPSKTLMPDRSSVSSSAKSVWKYYKNNRSDIQALPFDTSKRSALDLVDDTKTDSKEDDCFSTHFGPSADFLNHAYRSGGGGVSSASAIMNHKKLVDALNSHKDGLGQQFEEKIASGGAEYFSSQHMFSLAR